jgi:uncharacterized protein YbjT (DUF2867 family)/uncharacterized protein YndB with AHSA1/START domain
MNSAIDAVTRDAPPGGLRLVFGASGYIGSNLVPFLRDCGVRVRASARRRDVLEGRAWDGVEIVTGDALDPDSLDRVLRDVDTAYYLVHSMAAGRDFGRLDLQAAENFAAAAARAGVRRIVYLGGLVPEGADSEHIRSRRETGETLRRGSVPVTEVRAGIIVGPGSAAFEVMRDLVFHLPLMLTPRWVRAKSPPIALDNLLVYLLRLPEIDAAAGRTFDAAGPDTLTYEQMMRALAKAAGRRTPWIIPVPILSPRLSSYWLKFVTAVPTNIARALIEGLKHDFTADTNALRELVPQRLLGFRESIDAAFAAEREGQVAARWVEGAYRMRQQRIDYAYYAKRASGSAVARADPEAVWRVVTAIGGDNRYYYLNGLWTARETLDWLVGGRGLQRGRRDPQDLRVGDKVDSWEVIGIEPGHRLTLAFGMRAPGAGVLEFVVEPLEDHGNAPRTRVTATAYWHPAGFLGLAYWFSLEPAHKVIFDGLTREIARRAQAEAGRGSGAG